MKKKFLLFTLMLLSMILLLTVGVSAAEEEAALKITPGRTVSVTLPEGVGNYTYNEEIVVLKGFSTDENGVTTLLLVVKRISRWERTTFFTSTESRVWASRSTGWVTPIWTAT